MLVLNLPRKGHINIAVEQYEEADFPRESEHLVQGRIFKARCLAGNFRRHKFLMDRKVANAGKYAGKGL